MENSRNTGGNSDTSAVPGLKNGRNGAILRILPLSGAGKRNLRIHKFNIKEKNYALPFASDPRKLFKVGVNFSNKLRNIEQWIIE